jgi:GDPmannose 4,6-dehydratase
MAKTALITGVTGQDGAYLAELLLDKGYVVHGIKRRSSSFNTARIDHLYHDRHERGRPLTIHHGDMTDATNLIRLIQETQPDEIYNLAAQSHVQVSFEQPEYTANADGLGTLRLLEALRILKREGQTRFFQASTSELYGNTAQIPQNETTPFAPRSPYGETFVTRKITRAVAAIRLGLQDALYIGNLDARRDWGHARDYVEGMWLMLQQERPDDYVLASGEAHSVREFINLAFRQVDRQIVWEGSGAAEIGRDGGNGKVVVRVDPRYLRPTEVDLLVGDASKAERVLGWRPRTPFAALVAEMMAADMRATAQAQAFRSGRSIDAAEEIRYVD